MPVPKDDLSEHPINMCTLPLPGGAAEQVQPWCNHHLVT